MVMTEKQEVLVPPDELTELVKGGDSLVATRLRSIERGQRRLTLYSVSVITIFFGGLTAWSLLAPLDSAVVAEGQIVVSGNRNVVQSERSGVVRQILVRDGDRVEQGQIVVRLDSTKSLATYEQLLVRSSEIAALRARLVAERDGLDDIVFPADLTAESSLPFVAAAIKGQRNVFSSRKQTLKNQAGILNQKIQESREEISGLQTQMKAGSDQLALLRQEAADVSQLVDEQLSDKPHLLALQRATAQLSGSQGELTANIARAEQSILGSELQIIDLKNKRMDEIVQQLREAETTGSDLDEQLRAAKHDLDSADLPAPKTGIVVGSAIHTVGGVVGAGDTLMEIVPEGDLLVVEARVRPEDIDHVHQNLRASVRLVGFNTRVVPSVDGVVTYVSADSLLDRGTNMRYYLTRISLNLAAKPETASLKLQPGMLAHVMVLTGNRTLFDYLVSPITDSISSAMHEI